jgi:uncharacterized SAM-binding protein YcdF (DUF218 family)
MNEPVQKPIYKKRITCLISCFFMIFAAAVILTGIGAILVIADPVKQADAAVILSGGDKSRMQEAISLYNEKIVRTIILTETGSKVTGFDTDYSFEQRLALMDADIPSSAILITPKHSDSTQDEARAVLSLLGNDNTHDIIVVTDSYHTLRTRLIWRDIFKNSGINIIVRPDRGSWYKSSTWWLRKDGWEATILEYAKLLDFVVFQKGK